MLVEFSVENFLSFKDRVTLSMVASSDKTLPQNVIWDAQGTGINLLKSCAVYGANASGKSNLIRAMNFMRFWVLQSALGDHVGRNIGVIPFKLDFSLSNTPSMFEAVFLNEGVRYVYGFSATPKEIQNEWLYSYPRNRKRILFHRDNESPGHFIWGPSWRGEKTKLAGLTRPDALFISVAEQFNHPIAKMVVEWFSKKIINVPPIPESWGEELLSTYLFNQFEDLKKIALEILRQADIGVDEIRIEVEKIEDLLKRGSVPSGKREKVLTKIRNDVGTEDILVVNLVHRGFDEKGNHIGVPFEFSEESDGTIKLYSLLGHLLGSLVTGQLTYADEIDIRLHPLLIMHLLSFFNDNDIGDLSQLLFTTHDTNLLEQKNLLRRDQIWFTDKNDEGATDLYSLWDFKAPRKGENLRKGYLAGRYGGIPYIGKLLDGLPDGD